MPNTIKDVYDACLKDNNYFQALIDGRKKLPEVLRKKNLVLSDKDCKSLEAKLGKTKATDLAAKWLNDGLSWEASIKAEKERRGAKPKGGGGGEKGPEDDTDQCHWDDSV